MVLFPSTERLRIIDYEGKQVYLVDYSGLKQNEMVTLTNKHSELVTAAAVQCYFIANYENAFASAEYMQAAYAFTKATKPYIPKGAFLGIRGPKIALLKSVVYFIDADFKACKTEEDALQFITS